MTTRPFWAAMIFVALLNLLIPLTVKAGEQCIASHYGRGDGYHGKPVACRGLGPFNTYATDPYTVAHKTRACGSWVTVTSTATGRSIRAMVTDRGPFVRGRCVDLGWAGAQALGIAELGVGPVSID